MRDWLGLVVVGSALGLVLPACSEDDDDNGGCDGVSALEEETSDLINAHRAELGLVELELDACISDIARVHSGDMADGSVAFGHDGFDDRYEEMLVLEPTLVVAGENVAMNQGYSDPAVAAFQGWLDSPPHRENIELGDYDMTGMGVVEDASGGFWFTQLFVGH